MNELKLFENKNFGTVRTIEENGNVLFCGKDVATALGYSNTKDALQKHCNKDGVAFYDLTDSLGRKQVTKFIDEGNLYRLIAHSKLPKAAEFERWVFDEVLPTIRKTGGYVNDENAFINTYLGHLDERTKQLFSATLQEIRKCNEKIEADRPKVLFADAVETSKSTILVGDLAKLLKQNGVDIGQKRLFAWLRDHGYLIKGGASKNMPTQTAMDRKLFEVKETTISNPDGSIRVTRTTKVTGKGQQYFIDKFLGQ